MPYEIRKFDFGDEVQYFVPYGRDGRKRRGISAVCLDTGAFVSFVAEYDDEFVEAAPVVGSITASEFADFIMSKIKKETAGGRS